MSDNVFEILIKFGLNKEQATAAVNELKKIEEQTKTTGKEGVKQEEQVTEATNKTFTSKKQLKDMLKQIGHEFPLLGQIGRLALNPIAFTTAGITAAFVIWKYRTDELVKSLGGVEMPDFKEGDVERINRVAEAYKTLAEKMLATGTNAEKVNKQLELANKIIDASDGLKKAFGLDTGVSADAAKASLLQGSASALNASGNAKLAAAGRHNKDNPFWGNLDKSAAAAEAEKANIKERLEFIQSMREPESAAPWYYPGKVYRSAKFAARYGISSLDQAEGMERQNLAVQNFVLDRTAGLKNQAGISDKLRESGKADLASRDDLTQKLYDVLTKIGNQQAAAGVEKLGSFSPGTGSLTELVAQTGELASAMALLAQANANLKKSVAVVKQIVNNNNQR